MKTLSLKQPFAEMILSGKKTIEIRKWKTNFRGEFLVHASLKPDKKAMEKNGFVDLPVGKILGKVTLINVKDYLDSEDFKNDQNKHQASSDYGTYGFILEDPERFEKPIPAKGQLGFWNFDL
jgi:predicted transcriptional regulator